MRSSGQLFTSITSTQRIRSGIGVLPGSASTYSFIKGTQQVHVRACVDYELGECYRDLGDWQTAQSHFYLARDVFRYDEKDPIFNVELAWGVLSNLGLIEQQLGNFDAAEQMYLRSLDYFRELGSRGNMATILANLSHQAQRTE